MTADAHRWIEINAGCVEHSGVGAYIASVPAVSRTSATCPARLGIIDVLAE